LHRGYDPQKKLKAIFLTYWSLFEFIPGFDTALEIGGQLKPNAHSSGYLKIIRWKRR